jgi:hypothetical protein
MLTSEHHVVSFSHSSGLRSKVGYTVTELGALRPCNSGSRRGRGKKLLSSLKCPDQPWGPKGIMWKDTRGLLLAVVNQLKREADHLLPSSAELTMSGVLTPLFLHGFMGRAQDFFSNCKTLQLIECRRIANLGKTKNTNLLTEWILFCTGFSVLFFVRSLAMKKKSQLSRPLFIGNTVNVRNTVVIICTTAL